jgi:hypothetical protein
MNTLLQRSIITRRRRISFGIGMCGRVKAAENRGTAAKLCSWREVKVGSERLF